MKIGWTVVSMIGKAGGRVELTRCTVVCDCRTLTLTLKSVAPCRCPE